MRTMTRSEALFDEAVGLIPGGVDSPARSFNGVGGAPLFIDSAEGSTIRDVDGNGYIDYVGSYGPLILGHAHPDVVQAVQDAAAKGTSFGAPTALETELAQAVVEALPSVEMVRFVNSGTEATMSAVRLARGFTGRDKIVKFAGCYHGHVDALLAEAGSGVATHGLPATAGVPKAAVEDTLTAPYNDPDAVQGLFETFPTEIAAVIVEPVAGNMGVVPPEPEFLERLREITQRHDALLIFDEVMTGFRVAYGGAQERFDVTPDLTCFGKVIGGGLPVGAYGGRLDVMEQIAPTGPVYQAGTLSGNPLAMAAGLATLRKLQEPGVYEQLEERSEELQEGLNEAAQDAGVPMVVQRVGAMLGPFFSEHPVRNYSDAQRVDTERFARLFWGLMARGIYIAPSTYEAWFPSLAHSADDIQRTVDAAYEALKELA